MIVSADTNVFVYALDDRDASKQAIARAVIAALAEQEQPIALQVVGEVQNALRRRLKMPAPHAAQQARNLFVTFPSFAYDDACVDLALAYAGAGRFGYWDGLLLAACGRAGVQALLSEDMQDGQTIGGVQIINPFGPDGLTKAASQTLQL
ncbi:MAG: PIN domain-containing protein [Phenylobacterium sp.]|jgi:predicted nucleic acid-binding protein|nr:PIN domain-containing protein [Phenylobacterium sp.]